METSLNLSKNFNLPIYCNLCELDDNAIFSDSHRPRLRHPADIFLNRFKEIVAALNRLSPFIERDNFKEFQIKLKDYLHSLDTFYDNLYNIIKCLKEPTDRKPLHVIEWLKVNNHRTDLNFFSD